MTPVDPSIAKGKTEQFIADRYVLRQLHGEPDQSGDLGIVDARDGDDQPHTGLATGAGQGTSTISASMSGETGTTTLTVTAATLQSIAVTPANPSIAKGNTDQFTATGTFSDNSTQDLTNQVTWASATPATATITSTGLATSWRRGRRPSRPR